MINLSPRHLTSIETNFGVLNVEAAKLEDIFKLKIGYPNQIATIFISPTHKGNYRSETTRGPLIIAEEELRKAIKPIA